MPTVSRTRHPSSRLVVSLDTETTGLDFHHGANPFLVTVFDEESENTYWEWRVDPTTRRVRVPAREKQQIQDVLDSADLLVMQNSLFDVLALKSIGLRWDTRHWDKLFDTLIAGHLLSSNMPHDLTSMVLWYVGVDIASYDSDIRQACADARRWARDNQPNWRIAKQGLAEMPSVKGSAAKLDMWLLRSVAETAEYPKDHDWWSLCSIYANIDSAATYRLYQSQQDEIQRRSLTKIFNERMKLLKPTLAMEEQGITVSRNRLEELTQDYKEKSERAGRVCCNIAARFGADLQLPKSGNNGSLLAAAFDHIGLPVVAKSKKTGKPTLDKTVLEEYESTLPHRSMQSAFVRALRGKRKRDTAVTYMESWKRFWLPLDVDTDPCDDDDWYVLHPKVNPTGTRTLRMSSSNPNEQNISKQEGFNLRYCFGPAPGREWWSIDANNLELRLPAYESEETEMVDLFERPDDPPFFGNNHLLIFSILHPDKWNHDDSEGLLKAKRKYASTWYQWTKNGNFAVQYGAVLSSGTADKAYHVKGAQRTIQKRFKKIKRLNDLMVTTARQQGYVETIPDKTVDPLRGYPLQCTLDQYGNVLPTVPLNYHVSGTAMWWMMKAMTRCDRFLSQDRYADHRMIMQIHDELVFDIPVNPISAEGQIPECVKSICGLMTQGGDDIGIHTPVNAEYHPSNWSASV